MKLKKSLLATTLTVVAVNAHSAAFQLNETSASGLGRGFAGDAVIADDAAVLARNPAAMALFDNKAFSIAATYIDPGVDIEGEGAPDFIDRVTGGTFDVSSLDATGVVPQTVVPAVYFINPVNDKFAYGLAINANFGLASEYDDDYPAGSIAGETDLVAINANLSGSYRLNPQLSLGFGVNLVYGEAELIRHAGATGSILLQVPTATRITRMKGDDYNFGWNIGAVYEINDNHRFGFTYRAEVELDFEGDYTGPDQVEVDGSLSIDLPAIAEFSGFHQLSNRWAVHYSVMVTDWDSFDKLEAVTEDGLVFAKQENFESTYRYALGTTYTLNENVTLRAGIAFDESAAVAGFRSISIPDSDRLWYSVGATYKLGNNGSIDFGFSYIDGEAVTVREEDAVLELLPPALVGADKDWQFESEGNAILIGLQYNKSF